MKLKIVIIALISTLVTVSAQDKYLTKTGYIWFYSHTPMEDIKAHNKQVVSVLNLKTGEIAFTLLMKSFEFKKALMQEHFNENYVESDQFPKAKFKGTIQNIESIDLATNKNVDVKVSGELTIHGVTQKIETTGTLSKTNDGIKGTAKFIVKPADYDIEIPKVVQNNIAKEIEVNVDMLYKPLSN